jgi:hypothetical protein
MTTLNPRRGFDWTLVEWGAPDQVRTTKCSYCATPFREDAHGLPDEIPLILSTEAGWCAEFCEACQTRWWGFESFPDCSGND